MNIECLAVTSTLSTKLIQNTKAYFNIIRAHLFQGLAPSKKCFS